MYLFENPVLQHELIVNLRMKRSFVLLFGYLALLGTVVYIAWPQTRQIDLTNPEASQRLVNLFFAGQYVLASLMAPSFAAGSITGEKERKSYEMLLASPLQPAAIVLGKLLASLCHLGMLIVASLPIVMLCIPLGGVSIYEVLAAYLVLGVSVIAFGFISLACSSYFHRTAAALVVSYLLVLPLALLGATAWLATADLGASRLAFLILVPPFVSAFVSTVLFRRTTARLLKPPDVGSEGKQVIDLDHEGNAAMGLVIQSDRFPDWLFAPAKRFKLLEDGANPVFDKEMRSEIFSQGTLMLRVVIQISMALSIVMMSVCLFLFARLAPWYVGYVILFNMLVGPVFSAGSITNERERATLDLLLTTTLRPRQILWAKLVSGLRVSSVLTLFLMWPTLLAALFVDEFHSRLPNVIGYFGIIGMTCLSTAIIAMFCSTIFRRTGTALMTSYLTVATLFVLPVAANYFTRSFVPGTPAAAIVEQLGICSPIEAALHLPIASATATQNAAPVVMWPFYWAYMGFTGLLVITLLWGMSRLLDARWSVSD
jgi:ABC-type transport system involved in multi-copper enzyme maturation permease subunit